MDHGKISIRYVDTKENPADVGTRELSAQSFLQLKEFWFQGPEWLRSPIDTWPHWDEPEMTYSAIGATDSTHEDNESAPVHVMTLCLAWEGIPETSSGMEEIPIKAERYSSLNKLLRVTAIVFRVVKIWKSKLKSQREVVNEAKGLDLHNVITVAELGSSKLQWIRWVQHRRYGEVIIGLESGKYPSAKSKNLSQQLGALFLDLDSGIIRVKGRIGWADIDFEKKCPALLPQQEWFTQLVVRSVHESSNHAGPNQTLAQIRHNFWIPRGRRVVNSVLRECRICRVHKVGPYKPPAMSTLPRERVTFEAPFKYAGVDFFGPIFVKKEGGQQKVLICLFTCQSVQAIHLEVVRNMSTEALLEAFRKFIATRGKPEKMISDNGPQFILADNVWNSAEVKKFLGQHGIEWKFIPEYMPWYGGFYERLVGISKTALKKVLGRGLVTADQLEVVIREVADSVNIRLPVPSDRPLHYVSEDISDGWDYLSPNHFLKPFNHPRPQGIPLIEDENELEDPDYQEQYGLQEQLVNKQKFLQKLRREIIKKWEDLYLLFFFFLFVTSPRNSQPHKQTVNSFHVYRLVNGSNRMKTRSGQTLEHIA
ncbi:MAG: transposase family protein, partial [Gammaproteobacteria bacterium]|nr:transposase family protein [Gammaproteobacteria bacterium]